MSPVNAQQFQARLERLDALVRDVERFPDPAVRAHTREIVQALLELHATGLDCLLGHITDEGEAGQRILDTCAKDNMVGGLLLLHGLHPLDLDGRVRQALEQVRPYLRSHGGNVELLGVEGDVVRLRLDGSCHSCPSSAVTMRQTIEQAIYSKAPEVTAIEVEGLTIEAPAPESDGARVALPII